MSEENVLRSENIMQELTEAAAHESSEYKSDLLTRARSTIKELNTRAAPKVKQIKWRNFEWKGVPESESTNTVTIYSVFFRDHVSLWGANFMGLDRREEKIGHEYQDCAEAKAAAQSHYEKQILEALE